MAKNTLPDGLISREKAASISDTYAEVLAGEAAHDHELIVTNGVIRWKANPVIQQLFDLDLIDLNKYWMKVSRNAKNDPVSRQFYRDMGYSLFGYWEIFYWEVNNPIAHKWKP